MMNCVDVTKEYYARWLGVEADALEKNGVQWIYNIERNITPAGYSHPFDVYMFVKCDSIIISYGDRALPKIHEAKEKLSTGMAIEAVSSLCREMFMSEPKHNIKFVYNGKTREKCNSNTKRLTCTDYPLYIDFFKNAHPDCMNTSWIEEYFSDISKKGYCYGTIVNRQLVSATDAPDMPYMSERIQEIGINTLPSYRRKGYGEMSCLACINEMINNGICPIWSTTIDNIASQKLAIDIGFEKYFDNISFTLS